MARPLIGVCAAVERAAFGVWTDEPATLLPLSYSRAIHGAGGMIAMLPPDRVAEAEPGELLDRIDALVLGGGADIDPESRGVQRHAETVGTNPDRDRFEIALALGALERGIPLLGVCRGMQVLNVACGGTLDQHIPERLGPRQPPAGTGLMGRARRPPRARLTRRRSRRGPTASR